MNLLYRAAIVVSVAYASHSSAWAEPLRLEQAIDMAIENDPWLAMSEQKQASMMSLSDGASALPNPKFNVGLMNLPANTFDYRQEAMTQVQIGVSQMLPRGDTLHLQSQKLQQQSELMPLQREQRRAHVRLTVSQLWLDMVNTTQSIRLIQNNRVLFEQLTDIVESSYSSTFGGTQQHDLVKAELEVDRLDERLVTLQQKNSRSLQQLAEWLPSVNSETVLNTDFPILELPSLSTDEALLTALAQHPSIVQLDQAILVADTSVLLAEQNYKPEWMLNASYSFRGDDLMDNDRANLFSLGVSVDVPLFSHKRQDAQVFAESYQRESIKTERILALRTLMARYQTLEAEIDRLDQRLSLYESRLIPGLNQAAEASINAYTSDDGSFTEVVQARIGELNAQLTVLDIRLERSKKIAELLYLLTAQAQEIAS